MDVCDPLDFSNDGFRCKYLFPSCRILRRTGQSISFSKSLFWTKAFPRSLSPQLSFVTLHISSLQSRLAKKVLSNNEVGWAPTKRKRGPSRSSRSSRSPRSPRSSRSPRSPRSSRPPRSSRSHILLDKEKTRAMRRIEEKIEEEEEI